VKLAIVGSRTFDDFTLMNEIICCHFVDHPLDKLTTIISGGARGADAIAKRFALIMSSEGIKYQEFPAKWNEFGKSAGFKRNQQIVDACDMVLAFWDGKSKGTKHTIDLAAIAKKPTFIVYF